MDPSKLKEGETVDLKETFKEEALSTLCAFSNSNGGSLFIGVKDDSSLIGGVISDKLQQKIVSQIESVLRIQPSLTVHEFSGDEFLEIKVPKSNVPVDKRGVFYKRVGNTTRRIDREGLKDLLFHDVVWDSIIRTDTTQFDLNHFHIVPFALQAQQKFQLGNSEHLDTQEF